LAKVLASVACLVAALATTYSPAVFHQIISIEAAVIGFFAVTIAAIILVWVVPTRFPSCPFSTCDICAHVVRMHDISCRGSGVVEAGQ
jgi:hypothetical protein